MSALILHQPTRLSEFEKLGELGEGSCGKVFLARHQSTQRLFALKHYWDEEAFEREVRMLPLLNHPCLPVIWGCWRDDEASFYLLMELAEGRNLTEELEARKSLTLEETLEIGEQIAEAVAYLHSLTPVAVIHRDVKPKNIVWNAGKAVLVDFDSACFAGMQEYEDQGTWFYSPPEQDAGHPTLRSDVYTLGITLWELYTGIRPNPPERFFPRLPANCPGPLKNLLQRMVRLEAGCRPYTQEVLQFLRELLRTTHTGEAPLPILPPVRTPPPLIPAKSLQGILIPRARAPPGKSELEDDSRWPPSSGGWHPFARATRLPTARPVSLVEKSASSTRDCASSRQRALTTAKAGKALSSSLPAPSLVQSAPNPLLKDTTP